jgi:hypothetical protein
MAPLSPGKANNISILQTARATSAAQFMFKEMVIGEEKYVDGAFTDPNPVKEARQEAFSKNPGPESIIKLCVSIGTGKAPIGKSTAKRNGLVKIIRTLNTLVRRKALDCEQLHKDAERAFSQTHPPTPYYRLNTGIKVGRTRTGEWEQKRKSDGLTTLQYLTQETKKDLEEPEMKRLIKECAQALVDHRRRRTRNLPRWERFATCTTYACKITDCKAPPFNLRTDLDKHLTAKHTGAYPHDQLRLNPYLSSCKAKSKHPRGPW